ncbi:unannotated protein [freshwater metagenome]
MKWLVPTLFVVVPNDVVRAGNHTTGASGADASVDDLGLELLPLICPAGRSGGNEFLG